MLCNIMHLKPYFSVVNCKHSHMTQQHHLVSIKHKERLQVNIKVLAGFKAIASCSLLVKEAPSVDHTHVRCVFSFLFHCCPPSKCCPSFLSYLCVVHLFKVLPAFAFLSFQLLFLFQCFVCSVIPLQTS